MSKHYNVRVENRRTTGTYSEREKAYYSMLKAFKNLYDERGILHEYKKHEFYEKPSDRKRRKRNEQLREFNKLDRSGL